MRPKREKMVRAGTLALYVSGLLGTALTVLPFFRLDAWWIRLGDFPRVQIAILCALVAGLALVFLRPLQWPAAALILISGLCAVYQVYRIVPYTPLWPRQVEAAAPDAKGERLRILVANVLIDNRDYGALLRTVRETRPDVILLAETDEQWMRGVAELEKTHPHTISRPLGNSYGIALYSRLELVEPDIRFMVEDDIPSVHTKIRLGSGKLVKFFGVHPRPPVPTEAESSTARDGELILVGKEVLATKYPAIVAGDLNDVAWSRTTSLFQKISHMLDPRIGRGFYNTFHAEYFFLRVPLDHVFHTSEFRLAEMRRLGYIGSDHFPIFIELVLDENAELIHEEPEASPEEKKEANEMVEEAEEMKREEDAQ